MRACSRPTGLVIATIFALTAPLALPAGAQFADHPPIAGQDSLGSPDLPTQPVLSGDRYLDREFTYSITHRDVVYGGNYDHHSEWVDLKLDVWEPDNDEEFRPALISVHGGGFANGSKDGVSPERGELLAERGYVIVPINYRLRPDRFTGGGVTSYTSQIEKLLLEVPEAARWATEDAKAAVRWVRANAAELRVDPGRIAIAGGSAGGFVAMGVAFDNQDPGNSGTPGWPSHVQAAVAVTGAYGTGITGGPIKPGDPPMSFHHVLNDIDVPVAGTGLPCAQTLAMGNVCEPYIYPYEAGTWQYWHGFRRHIELVGARTASFLYRHMISKERTASMFTDLDATVRGDQVTVTGRLRTEDGNPLVAQRVQARSVHGEWFEATSGLDGRFRLTVTVPGHGQVTTIDLRYEGRSSPSWLLGDDVAPASATLTATWGGPPVR